MKPHRLRHLLLLTLALAGGPVFAQKAALVRDVDRPQAQPVNGRCNGTSCTLYTVPTGKRLTVTMVSHFSGSNGPFVLLGVAYNAYKSGLENTLFWVEPGAPVSADGWRWIFKAQTVDVILDESTELRAFTEGFGGAPVSIGFTFAGYLVDK